jgi:hypothetical protein
MMTISLLRTSEFDPSTDPESTLSVREKIHFSINLLNFNPQGAHIGLLEYALCALLRQQFLRNFHYSQLKPSTLMLGI